MKSKLTLILVVLLTASLTHALTYTVTTCADSGAGSLRQAITNANNNAGSDTIEFNIPTTDSGYNAASGTWTIEPTTSEWADGLTVALIGAFPILTDNGTHVNATTQPGYSGSPLIVIAGTNLASRTEGIVITASNCTIEGLVVNRFYRGILITDRGANNRIMGNYLGTNVTGTAALANTLAGVGIDNGAQNNTIGGTTAAQRNIISGNNGGVQINGGNSNEVTGNFIGTDVTGTAALGNTNAGVAIANGHGNTIGGTLEGQRNIISGNDFGIVAYTYAATNEAYNNVIIGNYIGTDVTGTAALGNTSEGIRLGQDASNNTVGGAAAGAGNTIAYNGGGVGVMWLYIGTLPSHYNLISRNSIFDNGGLGIDLDPHGVGPGSGANDDISHPVISTAQLNALTGQTTATGTAPASSTVEIFIAAVDPTGYGEGKTYLGSTMAAGTGDWSTTLTGASGSDSLTATATDANNNTSEFSPVVGIATTTSTTTTTTPTTTTITTTSTTLPAGGGSSGEVYYHPDTKKVQASFSAMPAGRAEVKLFSPEGIELGTFNETTSASEVTNRTFALQFREKPARDYYIVIISVDNKPYRKIALPIF